MREIKYNELPNQYAAETLRLYIEYGAPPGDFMSAVLANDLFAAVGSADHINEHLIPQYVKWIYNNCPMNCHGSWETVRKYMNSKLNAIKE